MTKCTLFLIRKGNTMSQEAVPGYTSHDISELYQFHLVSPSQVKHLPPPRRDCLLSPEIGSQRTIYVNVLQCLFSIQSKHVSAPLVLLYYGVNLSRLYSPGVILVLATLQRTCRRSSCNSIKLLAATKKDILVVTRRGNCWVWQLCREQLHGLV